MNCNITGERIKKLREDHKPQKISQAKLAKLLGYEDGNTVLHWERGRSPVPNDKLEEIADIFRVDIDYLLGNIDTKHYSTKAWSDHINKEIAYSNSYYEYLYQLGYDIDYQEIGRTSFVKARNNKFCKELTQKSIYDISITYPDGSKVKVDEAEMKNLENEIHDFITFKFENLKK